MNRDTYFIKPSAFCCKLFNVHKWLHKWRSAGTGALIGFLIGIITQITTDLNATSFAYLIDRLLKPIGHPLTWLFIISFLGLFLFWIVEPLLTLYVRRKRWEVLLADLTRLRTARSISSFSSSTITWGECLTLQLCHDLERGWNLEGIVMIKTPGAHQFTLAHSDQPLYNEFRKANKDKKWYTSDGLSYRLVKNPVSFSDTPNLVLEVQRCLYSQVQYTNNVIASSQPRQHEALKSIIEGKSNFANTFVIHSVVITSDNFFLATLSSPKKDYFGNLWSISIEEQLKDDDLVIETDKRVLHWMKRALSEELGVAETDYFDYNLRALSVFVEGHNLNCGLIIVAHLNITHRELGSIIESKPREDYEFTKYKFLDLKKVIAILRSPVGWQLHPTSEYRMFLTLVHKVGTVNAAKKIFFQSP